MILSRAAKSKEEAAAPKPDPGATKKKKKKKPKLEEFINARDYTGAITLLEFNIANNDAPEKASDLKLWLGFAYFHNGDYDKALQTYKQLLAANQDQRVLLSYMATCEFYLGHYQDANEHAKKGQVSALQNRVLFHIAHKQGDEKRLMQFHAELRDVTEDQLCLASIHYLRQHYNEAIEIYQRLLKDNRDWVALNVYMAMCYYKLDYYDSSLDLLSKYLQQHPDSATALNLKACNHFRLYDGRAAETELKRLDEIASPSFRYAQDIVRHNMVVFRGGENALQVLPALLDVLPEARLNLVIHYLHKEEVRKAYDLMKDVEPISPQEYILKGVVYAAYGQAMKSPEFLKLAQQLFQIVGASATECDTIPGRQCMASCLFLLKQFDDVLIYLNSIKTYFYNDDDFNYNMGIARAACGQYKDAEESLLMVGSDKYRAEFCYLAWLARCYIMNSKPTLAWELYMRMESTQEAFNLLTLIANDCYRVGHFLVAAKAFDVLERLDPNPEFWEAKRGACIGVFQQIIAGHELREILRDVIAILRNTPNNPQVEYIIRTMAKWAKSNHVSV